MTRRALIIGGGIGGLAAAIGLRQAGWEAVVFERAGAFREVGAGVGLGTNAVLALWNLGVGPQVEALGPVICQFDVCDWRGRLIGALPVAEIAARHGAPSLCVHRAELLAVLEQALPRETIHLGHEFERFEAGPDGVTAYFKSNEKNARKVSGVVARDAGDQGVCAGGDVLIGADGLHSRVRAQLLGARPPRYAGYTCWRGVAQIQHPRQPETLLRESWGPGRRFGAVSIGRGRVYWFATLNAPAGECDDPASIKSRLLALFHGWHAPVEEILAATPPAAILRNDCSDRRPVKRWGAGRVTLLGDAAHPTTPNLGQGACQAIEDAVALARQLGTGTRGGTMEEIDAALRRYERIRMPRTAAIVKASRQLGFFGQWNNSVLCALRNFIMRRLAFKASRGRVEKLLVADVG